nr:MAG TPA: hypothetical protein [Caudoviricetes sp.]
MGSYPHQSYDNLQLSYELIPELEPATGERHSQIYAHTVCHLLG